ncbi:hypothetical protein B0I72DRAFT_143206 [Yarrowia lipolytica]|uniref:YALI0A03817p n=2 Tax=Yarrowia lipolytica TaxID=4952 RepID=Q6CHX4_YARLI|nr:YALI0A03817p [Yarrowia lipolytica CLIB122]RDW22748.1 hypothetical protein B0I71DRAFT_137064 [Yarrowia lipolytica]RDW29435.1 hypothetical protein B0I72DRAFT_143206 [Yarrowia lipolytica]RDW36278.1 hypothetical protein B0I73DRAFT_137361 [Yarrowia lipolytica]CAG83660.1 YALI0A03817p [Yarrowia lipolytica CLIB122]|eukprot:XP_499737.1 YALI0A03817p [Yarrowia lipolytica CLIB122]
MLFLKTIALAATAVLAQVYEPTSDIHFYAQSQDNVAPWSQSLLTVQDSTLVAVTTLTPNDTTSAFDTHDDNFIARNGKFLAATANNGLVLSDSAPTRQLKWVSGSLNVVDNGKTSQLVACPSTANNTWVITLNSNCTKGFRVAVKPRTIAKNTNTFSQIPVNITHSSSNITGPVSITKPEPAKEDDKHNGAMTNSAGAVVVAVALVAVLF